MDYKDMYFYASRNITKGVNAGGGEKIVTKSDLMKEPINVFPSVMTFHDSFPPMNEYYDEEKNKEDDTNAHSFLGICSGT